MHRAASPTQSAADPASASRRHLPGGANPNTAVTRASVTPAAVEDGCDGIPLPCTPAVGNHPTVTLTQSHGTREYRKVTPSLPGDQEECHGPQKHLPSDFPGPSAPVGDLLLTMS